MTSSSQGCHAPSGQERGGQFIGCRHRRLGVSRPALAQSGVHGHQLGISEITVKAHRGRAMDKMQARSLAELVTMDARLRQRWPADAEPPMPASDELPAALLA